MYECFINVLCTCKHVICYNNEKSNFKRYLFFGNDMSNTYVKKYYNTIMKTGGVSDESEQCC